MPWTLHYWLTSPERCEEHLRERELLEHHPDVERVVDRSHLHTILEVWFEDELFRTEEPALLSIREARRRSTVPVRGERILQEIIDAEFGETPVETAPITDQRQRLIEQALAHPEYRRGLASGLIEPLRRRIDYQSIGRRAFLVEQLPMGALPTYDRGPGVPAILDQGQTGAATAHAHLPGIVTEMYSSITGYDPGQPIAYLGTPIQSGQGAYIEQILPPLAQVSGLVGMPEVGGIGHHLEISGSQNPANNGVFVIVRVENASTVWIQNPNAQHDYLTRSLTWNVYRDPATIVDPDYQFIQFSHVDNPTDPRARIQPPSPEDQMEEILRLQRAGIIPPGVPEGWARPGRLDERIDWEAIGEDFVKLDVEGKKPKKSADRPTSFARVLEDDFLEKD